MLCLQVGNISNAGKKNTINRTRAVPDGIPYRLATPHRVTALITQMLYLGVLDKIFVGAAPRVLALPTFSTMTREAQAILPVLQLRQSGSTSVYEPHV